MLHTSAAGPLPAERVTAGPSVACDQHLFLHSAVMQPSSAREVSQEPAARDPLERPPLPNLRLPEHRVKPGLRVLPGVVQMTVRGTIEEVKTGPEGGTPSHSNLIFCHLPACNPLHFLLAKTTHSSRSVDCHST